MNTHGETLLSESKHQAVVITPSGRGYIGRVYTNCQPGFPAALGTATLVTKKSRRLDTLKAWAQQKLRSTVIPADPNPRKIQ